MDSLGQGEMVLKCPLSFMQVRISGTDNSNPKLHRFPPLDFEECKWESCKSHSRRVGCGCENEVKQRLATRV
jgi:hypothetical protein